MEKMQAIKELLAEKSKGIYGGRTSLVLFPTDMIDWLIAEVEKRPSQEQSDDAKFFEEEHGKLVYENADLINFKESAEKVLSQEQLEDIHEEMENIPETI